MFECIPSVFRFDLLLQRLGGERLIPENIVYDLEMYFLDNVNISAKLTSLAYRDKFKIYRDL